MEYIDVVSQNIVKGRISLIDLAGSENIKRALEYDSNNYKIQQKEAVSINVSLMNLGKMINAVNSGDKYFP